ncbi:MAG TPA: hypothetical protein VGC13_00950 [Longimicrobium sp.]|jgi:hypothetical protein|uniref:hypothetical protein n=1 Tax=Longimicrobium sp. TaxID=2029185 RepID=UPI002EDB5CC6
MLDHVELARAAGRRLALELDPGLEVAVERLLVPARYESSPARFDAVGIAIAGLVVSIAQFVWHIYRDSTANREKTRESIVLQIRVQVDVPAVLTPEERDLVIDAVLEEMERSEPPRAISPPADR